MIAKIRRREDFVPGVLVAGILVALACDWSGIARLTVGFAVGYITAAVLLAAALAAGED
jgi:hypothetical protein